MVESLLQRSGVFWLDDGLADPLHGILQVPNGLIAEQVTLGVGILPYVVAHLGGYAHLFGTQPSDGKSNHDFNTCTKASCGMLTDPTDFMRFLPSFCFSSNLRLRVMSPP